MTGWARLSGHDMSPAERLERERQWAAMRERSRHTAEREQLRMQGFARSIWRETKSILDDPTNPGRVYFERRCRGLPPDLDAVLRYHPAAPFYGKDERCLVALITGIANNTFYGVQLTAITADGHKLKRPDTLSDRQTYGRVRGGAIKLWSDDTLTTALVVGEGAETGFSSCCGLQRFLGRPPGQASE
jgi:hypothetical protein